MKSIEMNKAKLLLSTIFLILSSGYSGFGQNRIGADLKQLIENRSYFIAKNFFTDTRLQASIIEQTPKNEVGRLIISFEKHRNCKSESIKRLNKKLISNSTTTYYIITYKNITTCGKFVYVVVHKVINNSYTYDSTYVLDQNGYKEKFERIINIYRND